MRGGTWVERTALLWDVRAMLLLGRKRPKLTLSARSQEAALVGCAALMTFASNGYLQEQDFLALFLKVVSGQQIFFVLFQFLGQYQLLSFTRDYAYRNIERSRIRRQYHTARSRKNRDWGKRDPRANSPLDNYHSESWSPDGS